MQYDLVTVVVSRRGLGALRHLLAELPSSFSIPIACLVEAYDGLAQELQAGCRLKVAWGERGMRMEKGHVYLSRPGESLGCASDGTLAIAPFGPESSAMNPVDTFLQSACRLRDCRLLALVLAGFDRDGVQGANSVRESGGSVLVLDRATARYWGMAEPIIKAGAVDRVLSVAEVAEALRGCFTSQDLLRCAGIQLQLGELLEAAMRISGTNMGHVTRLADSGRLRIIVQRGVGIDYFEHFEAMPMQADTAWCRAVRYKQRIFIPDVAGEPRHPGHDLSPMPNRAEIAVPLLLPRSHIEAHGAMTALFPFAHAERFESAALDPIAEQAAELVVRVS